MKLRDAEKALISRTLIECKGNRTHAARQLGIGIRTVQRKIARYGLDFPTSVTYLADGRELSRGAGQDVTLEGV